MTKMDEPFRDTITNITQPRQKINNRDNPTISLATAGPARQNPLATWNMFTLADAYQERPPLQYIAGNLFELPSLNIVYGPPGSLKSFLLADLLCCVASGIDWLQPLPGNSGLPLKVTSVPVIWIDFDNGKRRTHDRFAALGRAYKLSKDAKLGYFSMPVPLLNAGDKNQIRGLSETLMASGVRLLIIDNLGVISGQSDENTIEMVPLFANLRWLAEEIAGALVLIHHSRKSVGIAGRMGDNLRGHSSIEASLDTALMVKREANSSTVGIQATKSRGSDISAFSAQFTYEKDGSGGLSTARFYAAESQEQLVVRQRWHAVLECLGNDEMAKTSLAEAASAKLGGVGINLLRNDIVEMHMQGYLKMRAGLNNSQMFSRNPDKKL